MAPAQRIYFLLKDGTINTTLNLSVPSRKIFAANKKQAQSLHHIFAAHQVLAEIRTTKDRILYVNKKALDEMDLNDRLFLGRRDGFLTEIIGIEPKELPFKVRESLLNSCFLRRPPTVAVVGNKAMEIYQPIKSIVDTGDFLAPLVFQCSVIPTHTTTEIALYTDAKVLNKVLPAKEKNQGIKPGDLRSSEFMRSISAEALDRANKAIGNHPGKPEHVKFQKKVRNQMARENGYVKFDSSIILPFSAIKGKLNGQALMNKLVGQGVK